MTAQSPTETHTERDGLRLPPNELRRRQTVVRIIDAAVSLITEHGFDGTTTEEIANAAGCSRRTLFRYFRAKEDILFGDAYEQLELVRAELMALPRVSDPWQAAKKVGLRRLLGSISGETALPRDAIELWSSHPALVRTCLHINHQWELVLAAFFAAQRDTDPSLDLTSNLWAIMAVGVVRAVQMDRSLPGTDFDVAIDRAFALVERGIRPAPNPASFVSPRTNVG